MTKAFRKLVLYSTVKDPRWGTPNDMKGVALFLSAPASDYLNGAIIPVDGGYLGR
ncbi:SDR family oxidoreductase [Petroclostridium xylanilyticum]|uniref:SDR family oxidoreductase n=1 Tax=Petroclostridium xylanilyticum TaxID=1792311 RepID=UPI003BFA7A20